MGRWGDGEMGQQRLIVGWAVPSNAMATFGIGLVHCPPVRFRL
ncbi:hypothetical protein [Moorena sp. SIO4G3]|nr:hypothetical protein [Moorena sp. SIO4G3]